MKIKGKVAVCLLLFAFSVALMPLVSGLESQRNFVLIVWDGTERAVFQNMLKSGQLQFTSTLNIINECSSTEYGSQTVTRPQHASMLSGYLSDITGITRNDDKAHKKLPTGLSIFENTPSEINIVGAVSKQNNVADLLGFNQTIVYRGVNGFDFFDNTIASGSLSRQKILSIVAQAVQHPPYVLFIHLGDPDDAGHGFGVNSMFYKQALRVCDGITAQIYSLTKASNPLFIVTSDHGFGEAGDPYHHENSPNTFLSCNQPLNIAFSESVDIAATYYSYMQIPVATEGKPLS